MRRLQFNVASNWDEIYNQAFTATSGPYPNSYHPLPPIEVPIALTTPIIAVKALGGSAPTHWKYAGIIRIEYRTAIIANFFSDSSASIRNKIWLRDIQLFFLPEISSEYKITVEIPHWFREYQLVIWEYVGNDYHDSESKIDQILNLLQNP